MRSDLVKEWASAARDVLALLFTPVVTLIAGWLIYILAYRPWAEGTQEQRINYLGAVAIIAVVLVGFGGQWFQRNRLEKLKLSGPGGFGGEIETEAEPPPPTVIQKTTIETEVKS